MAQDAGVAAVRRNTRPIFSRLRIPFLMQYFYASLQELPKEALIIEPATKD